MIPGNEESLLDDFAPFYVSFAAIPRIGLLSYDPSFFPYPVTLSKILIGMSPHYLPLSCASWDLSFNILNSDQQSTSSSTLYCINSEADFLVITVDSANYCDEVLVGRGLES